MLRECVGGVATKLLVGGLSDLKNWRPVALFCGDYKVFAKVLSNRLKSHWDQMYCVPGCSITDHLFIIRDIIIKASECGPLDLLP